MDSSSSLSSEDEDTNEWTIQCTRKRESLKANCSKEIHEKKPNKRSAPNFESNKKEIATFLKEKKQDLNQQSRKTKSYNASENERKRLKETIVGDSQVNLLNEMKLCNDSRQVEKSAKGA